MAIKEIREFGDFSGTNNEGYIIIGGKTASIEGGKKLLSDVIPSVPQADEETITNDNGELKVTNPIPMPAIKDENKVLTCEHNYDTNTDEIVWKNRCYCDEDRINLSFGKLDTDTFGTGDTPHETIMVYRPDSSWPDWKHNPGAKLDVYPEYKNTESFVNDNLYIKWPKPDTEDFPTPISVGDIIEYKLVAEITGFDQDNKPQISLYWTKAT